MHKFDDKDDYILIPKFICLINVIYLYIYYGTLQSYKIFHLSNIFHFSYDTDYLAIINCVPRGCNIISHKSLTLYQLSYFSLASLTLEIILICFHLLESYNLHTANCLIQLLTNTVVMINKHACVPTYHSHE